jgi:hypothetical protein
MTTIIDRRLCNPPNLAPKLTSQVALKPIASTSTARATVGVLGGDPPGTRELDRGGRHGQERKPGAEARSGSQERKPGAEARSERKARATKPRAGSRRRSVL